MNDALLANELNTRFPGLDVREHEPMSRHTTFRIGGRVSVFCRPGSVEEAAALCAFLRDRGVRPFVMGRGSNLLFTDEDLSGVVIQVAENLSNLERTGECTLYAQAGATLVALSQSAQREGLSGLEFAGGIPGAVGGGVTMNAGAYGGEMKDAVTRVDYLDEALQLRSASNRDCAFSYRRSAFSDGGKLILGAELTLTPADPAAVKSRMDALKEKRVNSQPLNYPSAGSTFKRPAGAFAAQMIDEAGLKGRRVGGAQVSEKHAGFVINRGGATCADVLALMEIIQNEVERCTGIRLEPEVKGIRELGL